MNNTQETVVRRKKSAAVSFLCKKLIYNVKRDQLDRLIDDVAAVNETVDGIIQKIGKIKEG